MICHIATQRPKYLRIQMAAATIESGSSFTQYLRNNGQWSFAAGTYPRVGVVGVLSPEEGMQMRRRNVV